MNASSSYHETWLQRATSYLVVLFLKLVVHLFFHDVEVDGLERIPRDAAIIFAGNHHNQFLDPIVLLSTAGQNVSFLIAAKSMSRAVVGMFARLLRCIPVQRPQDSMKKGTGRISLSMSPAKEPVAHMIVTGSGTQFTKELHPNDSLVVKVPNREEDGGLVLFRVISIDSDTSFKAEAPSPAILAEMESAKMFETGNDFEWKYQLKIDQSGMFKSAWQALGERGWSIGIFPEGGSHDRQGLLPLKAGISVIALGAASQYPNGRPIVIVPVGLNYFRGHKWRSRVMVEYGQPIVVSGSEWAATYAKGGENKRIAGNELLARINAGLEACVMSAPSFKVMQAIHTVRRLYKPSNYELSPEQYIELSRRLVSGYEKLASLPEVKALFERVLAYNSQLKKYGIIDYFVATTPERNRTMTDRMRAFGRLLYSLINFIVLTVIAIPGGVLNIPLWVITKVGAKKEAAKALAGSSVKLAGRDVMSSYKVVVSFVLLPCLYTIYTFASLIFGGLKAYLYALVSFPSLSYISMRIYDKEMRLFRRLRLYWVLTFHSRRYEALRRERKELKTMVRSLVEKFGPQFQFFSKRIISSQNLELDELHAEEQLQRQKQMREGLKKSPSKTSPMFTAEPSSPTSPKFFALSPSFELSASEVVQRRAKSDNGSGPNAASYNQE